MKVHVPTKTLGSTLAHLERIIPARSSNPGLSSLLFRITDERVILSGTNLEVDLEAFLTADAVGEGTWAVPAQVFHSGGAFTATRHSGTFEERAIVSGS